MKHFLGAAFRDIALFGGQGIEGRRVGGFAPQPFGHIFLTHFAPRRGDAGLAEIFLGENVAGDLRPSRRHLNIVTLEHHRPVRVADFAAGRGEGDSRVGIPTGSGESARDFHTLAPKSKILGDP